MVSVQEGSVGPGRGRGRVSGLHLREQGNPPKQMPVNRLILFLYKQPLAQRRALMFVALLPFLVVFRIRIGFEADPDPDPGF